MSQQDAAVLALSEQLIVASYRGQAENVIQLINRGARVAVTKYGRSPLHLASHKGHTEVVRILLQAGCDPDIEDDGGQTALHRAAVVGNTVIIKALMLDGCSLDRQDKDGNIALHEASWHGFSESVKLLVRGGANVHAKNRGGNTALHLACQNGHAKTFQVLLLGGGRPDIKNNIGDMCLHVAVRYNHVAVVWDLLSAFTSVDEQNQVGDTALHIAASLNHRKVARLLLQAGAGTAVKNTILNVIGWGAQNGQKYDLMFCVKAGQTALDQAREHNSPDVAALLVKVTQVPSLRKRKDKLKVEWRAKSVPLAKPATGKESGSRAGNTCCCGGFIKGARKQPVQNTAPHQAGRTNERKPKEKPFLLDPKKRPEKNVHRMSKLIPPPPPPQPPHRVRAYQLYTLYRSENGQIMQAPMQGCCCEPLISKLENQLEATKELMKSEIHTIQEQMNSKLREIDHRNQLQIKVLDKRNQKQVALEKTECYRWIEQRSALELLEEERRQAAMVKEMKRWCQLKIQDIEACLSRNQQSQLPCGEVTPGAEAGCPAVLPDVPGDAQMAASGKLCWQEIHGGTQAPSGEEAAEKQKLEERNNSIIPLGGGNSQNHSIIQNQTVISMNKRLPETPQIVRPKKQSPHQGQKDPVPCGPGVGHRREGRVCRGRHRKQNSRRISGDLGGQNGGEAKSCAPPLREHKGTHREEEMQSFFRAVSAQMDRWCERKTQKACRQVEERAQQDRATLLQRISTLESDIQLLRTGARRGTLLT